MKRQNNGLKLHLGCGNDKREGYVNCDISSDVKPDKIVDLEKKLPFKDNSVDEIITSHTLEHVRNLIPLLNELHRICKKGARIKIRVPYFAHESAFSMMDHVRFFSWTTFDFLDKDHPCHWQRGVPYFKVVYKKMIWRPNLFSFFNRIPKIYQNFLCWMIPAKELYVELETMK